MFRESTRQTNQNIARSMESAHRTSLAKGEVGIRDKKTGLSWILPERVTDYRCQADNPVSLDRSIHLDAIQHCHQHGDGQGGQ